MKSSNSNKPVLLTGKQSSTTAKAKVRNFKLRIFNTFLLYIYLFIHVLGVNEN